MRVRGLAVGFSFVFLVLFAAQLSAGKRPTQASGYGIYADIPGATRVGSDTCAGCHAENAKSFQHGFHKQQGVECEDCHGNGSLHFEGGGDVAKIVSFSKRPARDANGVCLGCHARDEKVRHWLGGTHAANHLRCVDCHQIHAQALKDAKESRISFDTTTRGALAAGAVSPETNVMLRSRSETNDACLKCHQSEGAQLSMPYHHPLREGKMSCVDCHDAHGGPAGNNLKTANVSQLCLGCHAQYRGPFAYQHPPVTENCMNCHNAHGSPNTNLLSVSEPALCLQCHAGHHNGASLPLPDRCTNCHGSIHGTDVATPTGGSRFIDKGPLGVPSEPAQTASPALVNSHAAMATSALLHPVPSHVPTYAIGVSNGALGVMSSRSVPPLSGASMVGGNGDSSSVETGDTNSAYSITPGSYRLVDQSGYGGRVGEYDTLQQSAGADAVTSYVSPAHHTTVVSRGNVLTADDYSAASQLTVGEHLRFGFDTRGFVQQQDHYPFYAFPVMDVDPGSPPSDTTTELIPSHATFGVKRRLGNAYAQLKVPRAPIHLFVNGNWQARVGTTQLGYLDENSTAAIYVGGVNTTCGQLCHYTSRLQPVNYTTRNISGGADIDLGPVRLAVSHHFSSFTDRLTFPTATYTGPFTPENEGISIVNPPPSGPAPTDFPAGNYYLDIPSPSQSSADRVDLTWTQSPKLNFNGNVSYTRLSNTFTHNPQNTFESDETLNWHPVNRLRVIADYHQQNLINNFIPYYSLYGNVSYHRHWEGLRGDYEFPGGFDLEAHYRRSEITRSNAALWPQIYSADNTDLQTVIPSSFSNTTGLALRYHDHGYWSARAGYEWTGTHDPGYLIVPQNNNRIFGDVWLTAAKWLVFTNDINIIAQNTSPAIPLPNTPGTFQRSNHFYTETASANLRFVPGWNLGLGYSYQQNNLKTYMAFQNDNTVGYVIDEPVVPYKQVSQVYWGESTYTVKQRVGINLRLTYNSSRSGMRPDVNPSDAALLGNQSLIQQGAFDPMGLFPAALGNVQFAATQVSQVTVPQWIGQSKVYYILPRNFEGGLIFDYSTYRDGLNPNLNGVLRTFNVYAGRSW